MQCWWVTPVDSDGRRNGLEVYQWQPSTQKWCRLNEYGCDLDFDLIDYFCVAPCPTPQSKEDVQEIKSMLHNIDTALYRNESNITFTPEEYFFIRRMLQAYILND